MYGGITAGAAIAAGAAVTFAGAMAVAGGMLAGLGVLSGDKDFQRMGSIVSSVGGLANAAQGLAGAGSSIDAATTAGDYANQMDLASDVASAGNTAQTGLGSSVGSLGQARSARSP